jgi:hypothetical protein
MLKISIQFQIPVVDGGTLLSLKIAHFPDCVAAGYLQKKKKEWFSDGIQMCGRLWKLSIKLLCAQDKLARRGHPPKYLGCYLYYLPPTGCEQLYYQPEMQF